MTEIELGQAERKYTSLQKKIDSWLDGKEGQPGKESARFLQTTADLMELVRQCNRAGFDFVVDRERSKDNSIKYKLVRI